MKIEIKCKYCSSLFVAYQSLGRKYCSKSCSSKNGNFRKGHKSYNTGESLRKRIKNDPEYKRSLIAQLGNGMAGKKHSRETRERMSKSAHKRSTLAYRKKMSRISPKGKDNHLYIHGKGYENETKRSLFMRTPEYRHWRKSVFERDCYTCQVCKVSGGSLQADHIKPFALYKDLRLSLENGRTLCAPCHKNTSTYGARVLTSS